MLDGFVRFKAERCLPVELLLMFKEEDMVGADCFFDLEGCMPCYLSTQFQVG